MAAAAAGAAGAPSAGSLLATLPAEGEAARPLDAERWHAERGRLVETPYLITQLWVRRLRAAAPADPAPTLSAVTALGGDLGYGNLTGTLPEGGAILGLLKAVRREVTGARVKALGKEPGADADAAASAWPEELDGDDPRLEVGFLRGRRRVPRLLPAVARPATLSAADLPALRYALITGGARGITAEAAVALARAGVRKLPPRPARPSTRRPSSGRTRARSAARRWPRRSSRACRPRRGARLAGGVAGGSGTIERGLEAHRTQRRLAEAGAEAVYHAVDVADAAALRDAVRHPEAGRADQGHRPQGRRGALRGFETKSVEGAAGHAGPKVDGLLNLLAHTAGDPLRLLVAFLIRSGRFGGLGQADYSLANDLMSRLVGAYAAAHRGCRAVAMCWPAWDAVAHGQPRRHAVALLAAGQELMPPEEGVRHFLEELSVAAPEAEVTFTDGGGGLDADGTLPHDHASASRREALRTASSGSG